MKKIILLLITVINISVLHAQHSFKAIIKDRESKELLTGATAVVEKTTIGATSDTKGLVEVKNIPEGKQVVLFSYVGYETLKVTFDFPLPSNEALEILLSGASEELEEIVIASTRSSRTIDDIPTRVEFIAGEELEEKGNMKPGDIRMMLNESTGIQTQQTSATSYNSSIRIQGLDGKYTQLIRDGFPLYSGFSGGLSLLQIAPLDLERVEVIKGASSTLYGGGAIAGLVNLISKTPKEERELNFLLNTTSALGMDASGFYSKRNKKIGSTIFASYNLGSPYDPAGIGLTAIPKFNRYTINPKLFFYPNDRTTVYIGFNNTAEDRRGGDINYIKGDGDSKNAYYEKNRTDRFSTQFELSGKVNERSKFSLKNSVSYYDRSIEIPNYTFSGTQLSSFSELNYSRKEARAEWITGINLWTDGFTQDGQRGADVVDYDYVTLGAFVQNTLIANDRLSFETGLRGDYHNEFGFFVLPRVSALLKANQHLSLRLGGGMGYKAPTVFTEDAERIQFRNVLPLDLSQVRAEQSIGTNFDIDYKTPLAEGLFFSINTLFFYTQVRDPLTLEANTSGTVEFQQPSGFIDTKGVETNAKLAYEPFKLFVGYTLADVKQHYDLRTDFPLVARHRLNNVLMYEVEEKLKIGLEAYYFSPQKLNDGTSGKPYWIFGLMTEKLWDHFSVFLNFENFTDTRQTRFDTINTGSRSAPVFRDIYAPLDGFVINGGLKLKL